jgi:hypothetical protein
MLNSRFLPQRLLQAADFRGNVGRADSQHIRDLLVIVPI